MAQLILSESLSLLLMKMEDSSKVASLLLNNNFTTTEFGNYITARGHSLTFCPAKKEQAFNEDGTWKRECRQEGRPAKIARALLNAVALARLDDKDFEIFANKMKATEISRLGSFQIVEGEEIKKWYYEDTYESNQSSLNESCMRYDYAQKFFGIYVRNPDQVKMLIFVNSSNRLLGRAILWYHANEIFMDRIYGNDSTVEAFREYAEDHGYYWRKYNNRADEYYFVKDNETHTFKISVKLDHIDFEYYPYMDTFKFLSLSKSTISNNSDVVYDYELTSTDGNNHNGMPHVDDDDDDEEDSEPSYVLCSITGQEMLEDDACYVRGRGWVSPRLAVRTSFDRTWILRTDSVVTHLDNYTCHISSTEEVEGNRYWVDSEHIVRLENGTFALADKCRKLYNGTHVLKDEAVYCQYYNLYVYKKIATEIVSDSSETGYVVTSALQEFLSKNSEWKVSTTLINN